jgi:hypothetical protein
MPDYPHMRPADEEIWNRFIDKNPDRFSYCYYDFRVGDPACHPDDCPRCVQVSWYDLTRWQIDVIACTDDTIYIIEVKPSANAKAIGQALAYATLFAKDQKPDKRVVPVVLTDEIIPTTKRVADELGVELWVA